MAGRDWFRHLRPSLARFCSNTASSSSAEATAAAGAAGQEAASAKEISVADFLKSIGKGVEAQAEKVAKEVEALEQLLLVRRMKLKKIGVPCKQRKLIMRYTEKYRQNLWRPKIAQS